MSWRGSIIVLSLALSAVSGCRSAERHFDSGNRYAAQGKLAEAVIEYRSATVKDPRFGLAHFKLAETYSRLGQPANAFKEYIYAADLLPDSADAQLKAGASLLLARRFEDARARAERVLARDPKNLEALLLRGNATYGLKDIDGAVKQVEEAIQVDPKMGRSFTMLGALEAARGDASAAEKAYRQAVDVDPKSAPAQVALGQFLAGNGRQAEAETAFKAACRLDPEDPVPSRMLASFYLASNRAAEAEPYLRTLADRSNEPGPKLALADYYAMTRHENDAVALLTKIAATKAGHLDATLRLASIQYSMGRTAEAHKTIDSLLVEFPKNPGALLVKVRFLLAEQKLDEALAKARLAVDADPRSAPARYWLGRVYVAKHRNDDAIAAFEEVLKINPRVVAAEIQLSRLQMARGAVEPALEMAEAAAAARPDSPSAHLALVRSLVAGGQLDRAESELKGLLEAYPKAAPVRTTQGALLLARKDPAGARRAFEEAIRLDGGSVEALTGLVMLDLASKRFAEAGSRVESRLARTPYDPAVLVLAARTYANLGDWQKSEAMLVRTLNVAPDSLEAYGLLAQVYLAQNKLDAAREKLGEVAARQTKPVSAETMIGLIFEVQGRKAEAQRQYQKVLAIDPRAPVAANNLAWMYADSGENLDVALQLAQTAKAGLPAAPETADTLGWVYYKKELPAQAIPYLRDSVDKDPQKPDYVYHLGMAQVKSGDVVSGRRSLEQALKLGRSFPGADEARRMLASLK